MSGQVRDICLSPNSRFYARLRHEDYKHKYDHLLKDVPFDKDGNAYIRVENYEDMTISIGTHAWPTQPHLNPVEDLQYQARYVRSMQKDFKLTAEFVTGDWPLGLGFQRLGEFLAFLGDEEIVYQRWHKLTVSLPDLELPYNMLSSPMLPLDAFANLRELTWRGHRKQLLASWIPLLPSILQTLTTLEIQCDIALQDCFHLLYCGINLKKVTLKIIQKELSHETMFDPINHSGCMSRPWEYLCIVSDDDIEPLLRPFKFPSLRNIHFTLGYISGSTFAGLNIWKTVETMHMRSEFSCRDRDWIHSQFNPATQHKLWRYYGGMKGAASFLHTGPFHPTFSD